MDLHCLQTAYVPILRETLRACRCVYGDRLGSLAVFGSVGRGTARPDSDIDLLLVARDLPRGRMARNREFEAVERILGDTLRAAADRGVVTRLSVVFRTPQEAARPTPILLDMVEDARLLLDEGGVLEATLGRLRARLAELGARRLWRGTRWYWDLKPDFQPGDVVSF
jgi:hypothetical protein